MLEPGFGAAGSKLQSLDLSRNRVRQIGGMASHRFLRRIVLSNNCIESLAGFGDLRFLEFLDLSNNALSRLDGMRCASLRKLVISGNRVTDLGPLTGMQQLVHLEAASNQVESLEPLSACAALRSLDVRHNRLRALASLAPIMPCRWLHVLALEGNPLCAHANYREAVVFQMQKCATRMSTCSLGLICAARRLTMLDGQVVSAEEKVKTGAAFGQEHAARQAHFADAVVGSQFVDHA